MFVLPLVNEPEFVVGDPENSGLLPPATDAIVKTAGSYVTVTEYAPSGVEPTSTEMSVGSCWPTCTVPGQVSLPCAPWPAVPVRTAPAATIIAVTLSRR